MPYTLTLSDAEMAFMRQMFDAEIPVSLKHVALAHSAKDKFVNAVKDKPSGAVSDSLPSDAGVIDNASAS